MIKIALQGEIQIVTFAANRDGWFHDALLFGPGYGSNDKGTRPATSSQLSAETKSYVNLMQNG
jgi:hypothetical protein